ncbi:MAG: hypothetical protein PUD60_03790 [Akkermansia muciniphila]|nr:hypothetical protein [Akkermansia muciniphila]
MQKLKQRPLLQAGCCIFGDYDTEWIEQMLQEAADATGVALPMRHEIARGVMTYMEDLCPLRVVPLSFFFERLRDMLEAAGLPAVARCLRRQVPPVRLPLDELARETPLPLFFYTELGRRLEEMRSLGMNRYRFSGQRQCSLVLGQRRRTCPTQQRELRELEEYIRAATPEQQPAY